MMNRYSTILAIGLFLGCATPTKSVDRVNQTADTRPFQRINEPLTSTVGVEGSRDEGVVPRKNEPPKKKAKPGLPAGEVEQPEQPPYAPPPPETAQGH